MATLDYVVSSLEATSVLPGKNIFDSDHKSLDVTFHLPSHPQHRKPNPSPQTTLAWSKVSWTEVSHTLESFPWVILDNDNPAEAVSLFYDVVHAIIKEHVPFIKKRSRKFPQWYSKEAIQVLANKKRAWELWKSYPNTPEILLITFVDSPKLYFVAITKTTSRKSPWI